MKTLTLDEAFAKTSKAPQVVFHIEGESRDVEAALLAHCFNHMRELVEFLENLSALQAAGDDKEIIAELRGDFCKKLLAKSNTVQMPE